MQAITAPKRGTQQRNWVKLDGLRRSPGLGLVIGIDPPGKPVCQQRAENIVPDAEDGARHGCQRRKVLSRHRRNRTGILHSHFDCNGFTLGKRQPGKEFKRRVGLDALQACGSDSRMQSNFSGFVVGKSEILKQRAGAFIRSDGVAGGAAFVAGWEYSALDVGYEA